MDFELEIGSIIEFDDGDAHRLAIVTDTIGKKLVVVTADDDEMRITPDEATFRLGDGPATSLNRARRKLQKLDETIAQRRTDIELEMLWEFVREQEDPIGADELAEVMFADDSAETVVAMLRALRDNPVYFKSRRDHEFEPRDESSVEMLRRQREAEQKKKRRRQRVLDTLADILETDDDQRTGRADEAMGEDDALRNSVHMLQDFAAEGDDYDRAEEAKELLDDLMETAGVQLGGPMEMKAFELMVELGLWDEHYNLAKHRYSIDETMPQPLVKRAEELADQPWEPEDFRRDLTGWTTVTIDAPSSRDLDDALSCRPTIDGGWELAIHITDPSAFVEPGSPLDQEAEKRGTSVYLPTGTVPMFPRQLSEQKMSLLPQRLRPALTTRVEFDENLEIVDSEIIPSTIRVDRRLGYREVDEMLESTGQDRFADLVQRLEYVADECHNRRTEDAGAYFELPDTEIVVDDDSEPPQVDVDVIDGDTRSRSLVGELMILNNDMIGRFCARRQIPAIYRTQSPPDEPLVDDEIESIPEGIARTFAQIWRMNPGETSSQPGTHFGLGLSTYAQASSPIRRYTDLVCQRQVKAALLDEPLPYQQEDILEVLGSVERAAKAASTTERETERYWLLYHLADCDEPMDAIVIDHYDDRGSRCAVFIEDCAYRSKCTLRDKVPVGESIRVVVERADPRQDALSLRQYRE